MGYIVDLSKYQGTIDFAKLSKVVDLAIIRVQYGSRVIDPKYKEYVAGCKQYGIPFGHYAFGQFVSVNDSKVEAADFLSRIDKDAKFLVLDVEEQTCYKASDLVPASQAFIDACKKAGYKTGLYTGHSFYSQYGMNKVVADFLWIPRYPSNDVGQPTGPKPTMAADIWQYSQNGRVDGISGAVDLNQLLGSKTLSWYIGESVEVEKVATVTKPVASKPVAKKPASKKPATSTATHTVVSGDTLWELALTYKTTIANLKKLNGLKSDLLKVGQKLKVPAVVKYHTVKSGDNVTKIAAKYKTTIAKIKSLNPSIKDIDKISVGQKIRVA